MIRILFTTIVLILPYWGMAQINRPRTAPTNTAPPSTASRGVSAEPEPQTDGGAIAVKQANGIEIKLLRVEGNAADQQVTFYWIMNNPKANTDARFDMAYGVDLEGDEYNDRDGNNHSVMTLFTDVPKKGGRVLRGVPSKVKMLKLFKFNFWTQATNQWMGVEFRDLKIDWK